MEQRLVGGKFEETDSSPGVENFQQMTSDGSEVHGENGHSSGKGKSRKNRIIFNAAQLNALERLFRDVAYPDLDLRMKIAQRLEIDESRVTVWFQNRRAKYRRTSQQGTGDVTPTSQDYQMTSPASASPANSQQITTNFIQSIPVAGVEFNAWVNHSHSGDQSTVVHQLRNPEATEMPITEQGRFDQESPRQRRTLDWLQSQNSNNNSNNQAVSPYEITVTSPVEVQVISNECRNQTREHPKREEMKPNSVTYPALRNSSTEIHDQVLPTAINQPYQQRNNGRDDNITSSNGKGGVPPNRDVLELQENHLSDAMKRLSAARGGPSTQPPPSMFGGLNHNWTRFPSNIQHNSQPFVPAVAHEPYSNHQSVYYEPRVGPPIHPPRIQCYPPNNHNNNSSSLPSQDGWPYHDPRVSSYATKSWASNRLQEQSPPVAVVLEAAERPRESRYTQNTKYSKGSTKRQENNHRPRKRRHYSSDESGEDPSRNRIKRRKKYRKRRKIVQRAALKTTKELPLYMLADMRRRNAYISDTDNEPGSTGCRRSRGTEDKARRSERRGSSSFGEAATSSKSEKHTSSSTIFSSTSDSDFEVPYCKQTRPLQQNLEKRKNNVAIDKVSHVVPMRSNVGRERHEGSTPSETQYPFHSNSVKKKIPPHSYGNDIQAPIVNYCGTTSSEGQKISDVLANIRDDKNSKHSRKYDLPDLEQSSMLNFLFGPKSPDIPVVCRSDEDRTSINERKQTNEDILSESLKLAQMCNSPLSTDHSDLAVSSPYSSIAIEGATSGNQQFPKPQHQVGHVTAFQRDVIYNVTQKQYTFHYGDKASISSYNASVTTKPRGIIRPVPQKHSSPVGGPSCPAPPPKTTRCNKQGQSDTRQPAGRVTGTVRPWCDDYPRATSNPSQDVSRPVREPVPMEGPPPNKICTMVKDAISPVDLLAKYLTWTGNRYVAQQQQFKCNDG